MGHNMLLRLSQEIDIERAESEEDPSFDEEPISVEIPEGGAYVPVENSEVLVVLFQANRAK